MEYVLETHALTKRYRDFTALQNLNMRVPKGAIYGIVGRNGAGKTTLIRLICGLQSPTDGDYTLYGVRNTDARIARCRRRMGAVVEAPAIYQDMTAAENIRQQYKILGAPLDDGIDALLHLVGLSNTGKKRARNFSLGMRQRLGVAVALAGSPDFLVLDEPVNGLDPQGIIEMRELILKLNRERGVTILISSHILDELSRLATHYGFIDGGRMVQEISAAELEARCRRCVRLEVNDVRALVLGVRLYLLRRAIREAADELDEKLRTDTNTLISISSGDRAIRALAARMNRQLAALRRERLRLQNGDAELKNAVTNISHDLRTPLTAICGHIELLLQEPLPETAARRIEIIHERAEAMRDLTKELFKYTVINASADDLRMAPVSLNDVLEQSIAGLYGALTARGIQPQIEMPDAPVVRALDEAALRRVFDNVIGNAARYSDGDLSVVLAPDGEIRIENSAANLTAVQAARLFDRFYTVNSARGGTGLGLSIAKGLTEKMGGEIGADVRAGRLCVRIRFP